MASTSCGVVMGGALGLQVVVALHRALIPVVVLAPEVTTAQEVAAAGCWDLPDVFSTVLVVMVLVDVAAVVDIAQLLGRAMAMAMAM